MLVLGRGSCDLQQVTVRTASRFLNSAAKLSPVTGDFTNPGGPSMGGAGSLGGRFWCNGESSSPTAPHDSSATTESTRRGWDPALLCIGAVPHFH